MKLQKETNRHGKWYDDACGAAFAMELIGERWSLLIVRELMVGGRRFSDIRASLCGISAKVLTERLEKLEAVGILKKRTLPPPAAARIFELTEWGLALEPIMQELGRWSVRSPLHDPALPLTPVAFMLSLRTMIDAGKARSLAVTIAFEVGDDRFLAELHDGELPIRRAAEGDPPAQLTFRAPAASDFLPVFYGKRPLSFPGSRLEIAGDIALAERFIDLFHLPEKVR